VHLQWNDFEAINQGDFGRRFRQHRRARWRDFWVDDERVAFRQVARPVHCLLERRWKPQQTYCSTVDLSFAEKFARGPRRPNQRPMVSSALILKANGAMSIGRAQENANPAAQHIEPRMQKTGPNSIPNCRRRISGSLA
jgi:hypothetical protein